MLDPVLVRDQAEWVRKAYQSRHFPLTALEDYIQADAQWRQLLQGVEQLRSERKQRSPKGKPTPDDLAALKQLSDHLKTQEDALSEWLDRKTQLALQLPNIVMADVPEGHSETDNVEIKTWGTLPIFSFSPKMRRWF